MDPKHFTITFLRKEKVAKDTFAFYFEPSESYAFLAGQYNRLILPHTQMDERGDKRYFSIASSPLHAEEFRIVTKIIDQASSFKKTFFNLEPDTEIQAFGPMGNFIIDETHLTPCVFLVGGIGITPELSIVPYAGEKKLGIPITVIASFSTTEEIIEKENMEKITSENPSMKVVYTVTHPDGSGWSGETGRISEEMIKKYVDDISKPKFYIVGPPAMVKAMEELVLSMGVMKEKIVKESFTGY